MLQCIFSAMFHVQPFCTSWTSCCICLTCRWLVEVHLGVPCLLAIDRWRPCKDKREQTMDGWIILTITFTF
ncbi:hypothetical protein ATANTOWER_016950 [Ataeniobius toweri]|uniref:Secreted protein n=1 Tax=Ataeniobius toweri TaxID=208326 RepID=A0ABU7C822_9TELE|nr:hypothetical protein [Ataeniobius toweri]